jgi:hypothetical protein
VQHPFRKSLHHLGLPQSILPSEHAFAQAPVLHTLHNAFHSLGSDPITLFAILPLLGHNAHSHCLMTSLFLGLLHRGHSPTPRSEATAQILLCPLQY